MILGKALGAFFVVCTHMVIFERARYFINHHFVRKSVLLKLAMCWHFRAGGGCVYWAL